MKKTVTPKGPKIEVSPLFDSNKRPANEQKLRGGYYTPPPLAGFLARWALRGSKQRVLEPSAGDGSIVVACLEAYGNGHRKHQLEIVAVEIERDEIKKGQQRIGALANGHQSVEWLRGDFFSIYPKLHKAERFDVALGNPPFIRFQYFDGSSRDVAFKHLREAGYTPTKLANAWAAFVQLSIELLKDGGRLAMVLPAELLQVSYAAQLRSRLSRQFDHIILIGFRKLVFPDIQQEVVLLLAEGKHAPTGANSDIHTIEFEDGDELIRGDLADTIAHTHAKHSRNGMKWTALFLSDKAFKALDEAEKVKGLTPLGDLAEVDVGVVTGRNSFFVIDGKRKKELQVGDLVLPIVGRTSYLTSVLFTQADFDRYAASNPAYLLCLVGTEKDALPDELREYLLSGEEEGVHLGFKCRIRPRWFDVPSVYVPGGFMFRQIHRYPLIVVNEAEATSTDTVHRVRFKFGIKPEVVSAAAFNSLTLAWAEVAGRSYGGGVLELEPREAEELPIPYSPDLPLDIYKLDLLLRGGNEREALDYVDGIVLRDQLGFSRAKIRAIRSAWEELRDRRINRR